MTANSYNEGINAAALIVERAPIGTSHGELAAQIRALSTPNATVEQREAIARIINPAAFKPHLKYEKNRFMETEARMALAMADKIVAILRPDEAAIRKDEREKQREIDAKICDEADLISHDPSECRAFIVSAIRNGGEQP